MHGFRLAAEDEFSHPPTADTNFNESVYVNAFDRSGRFGGWMRLGNRVNEGYAELSVCLYLADGRVACQFGRPPISTNAAHNAGGLSYTVHQPLKRVEMRYAGEVMLLDDPNMMRDPKAAFANAAKRACEVVFDSHAASPIHGGEPLSPDQETMYGRNFSLGHFNQHTNARGHIKIGDELFPLDGNGWRDHSWGPRFWTNIYFYRLFIANFGPDRGFMLLKITGRDGVTRRCGVLQFGGDYEEITDLDVWTEWTAQKEPRAMKLGVRTAKRAVRIDGEVTTLLPLRNRRKDGGTMLESRIAECFTRWQWGDRTGTGMTEYIEILEDGVPVGYPL
jgi:hypothetical protein